MKLSAVTVVGALAALAGSAAQARPFIPGDLVVVRVGDGSAALSSASTAGFLHEYTPAGILVGSAIPLPTSASGANRALTLGGSTSPEGCLTLPGTATNLTLLVQDTC